MSDQTHYDGCWQDPKHHACALREIERLHEVERMYVKQFLDQERVATEQAKEIERVQGNNEKLLLDNLELRNEVERLRLEAGSMRAEIERLRSLCDSLADDVDRLLVQRDLSNAAIREAEEWRKEVERLRREYEKTWADAALKDADIERLQTARQRGARP